MKAASGVARRRRLRRVSAPRELPSRRGLLARGAAFLTAGCAVGWRLLEGGGARAAETERAPIRPPGAAPNDRRFRGACVRCGLCGVVCENGCIRFFGLDEPEHGALTPYLDLRRRSCTLCMRCTEVCPTGALRELPDDRDVIAAEVDMGRAVVDPDRCLSYLGRICGICYDACPLPGRAIRLIPPGKPVVVADGCVGCGRCVELCPQVPTAIDVLRTEAALAP